MQAGVTTRSRKSLYKLRGPSQLSEVERARRSKKRGQRKSVSKGSSRKSGSATVRKSSSRRSRRSLSRISPAAERNISMEDVAVSASPRFVEETRFIEPRFQEIEENVVQNGFVPLVQRLFRESPFTRASASPQAFANAPYRASPMSYRSS